MWPLLQFEVMYYFKNKKELSVISILFLSFFILAPFGLPHGDAANQGIMPSLMWLALLTCYCLIGNTLYTRDRESGRLEAIQLVDTGLEWLVLAKWLACFLSVLLPMLLMMPIAALLSGWPMAELPANCLSLIVGAAAISALTALVSAVMAGVGQGAGAILGLLVLPLVVPVMIFGCEYSRTHNFQYLLLLIGIVAFTVPLMCLAGASSIRHSN